MIKISIAKIDSYLERITDPNRRSVLRAVKKYVLELEGYQKRVGEFAIRYKQTDPNDVYFYESAGINLNKDFPTQIVEFKERIIKDAINGSIDKDLLDNVCAYFCSDVIKIEELYSDLFNPKREDREVEVINKIDGLLKTLGGLPYLHRHPTLDKSDLERVIGRISERLHKHGLKRTGRPFLIRLKVMKAPSSKVPSKVGIYNPLEPVTIEELEFVVNKLEKDVNYFVEIITEHAINCDEQKLINEVRREQGKGPKVVPGPVKKAKVPKPIEPGKVSLGIK